MARSQAQSDLAVARPPEPPGRAVASELPAADPLASAAAARWMLRLTALVLLAFALLCAIGPHLPAGE